VTEQDLRDIDVMWPLIEANLMLAVRKAQSLLARPPEEMMRTLRARYEQGEKLYKREWTAWDQERFLEERLCEAADLILYAAMEAVKFPEE
jgi:hypothetical protein